MSSQQEYIVLGCMSGTSLDGLDLAMCKFKFKKSWQFELLASQYYPYPAPVKYYLKHAFSGSADELSEIDTKFGVYIGQKCKAFMQSSGIEPQLIASHGHTIFHQPNKGYTIQIGSGAHIAAITGVKVVNNFRALDVAFGGQGAPLVPIGDKLLFHEFDACLNIGGFANISFDSKGIRQAYDVCAVNFVLNRLSLMLGEPYDKNGGFARSGKLIPKVLESLNKLPYYYQQAPKSLGQEWVDRHVSVLLTGIYEPCDLICTYTEHVAQIIAKELNSLPVKKVLFTGGGVYNNYLLELLRRECAKEIVVPNTDVVDMKEAIIFAFLGVLRLRGENNCLASVTGASRDSSGGTLYTI